MLRVLEGLPCPDVWKPTPSSTAPHVALGVSLLTQASLLSSGMGSMLPYIQAIAVPGGPVCCYIPIVSMNAYAMGVGIGSLLSVSTSPLIFC